jgi:hypothetical protein
MKRFFERRQDVDLEQRLRRERPAPRDEFVSMLADRLEPRPRPRPAGRRIALVAAVTAAFLAALGGTGGFAYAANAAKSVAHNAKVVVAAPVSIVKHGNGHQAKPNDVGGKPDDDQYGHRKHVCHKPGKGQETLEVDDSAVPSHLSHGDYLGDCRR